MPDILSRIKHDPAVGSADEVEVPQVREEVGLHYPQFHVLAPWLAVVSLTCILTHSVACSGIQPDIGRDVTFVATILVVVNRSRT
jgi:hypothetical protein